MNKPRILWTDDEIDLLRAHIIFLESKGYEVETANNGLDAVEKVKENYYDIIFLDENMPGMTGLETLTQIKTIVAKCTGGDDYKKRRREYYGRGSGFENCRLPYKTRKSKTNTAHTKKEYRPKTTGYPANYFGLPNAVRENRNANQRQAELYRVD